MQKINLQTLLRINPDCLLLLRNNTFIASNLHSDESPLPIQPSHLLLLNYFLTPKSLLIGTEEFLASETTKILTGNLPKEVVYKRIVELVSKNILVQTEHSFTTVTENIAISIVDLSNVLATPVNGFYKVHRNLSLIPKTNGYQISHTGMHGNNIVGVDILFTLLSLANATKIQDSEKFIAPHIEKSLHWQHIHWLISKKVLIKKKQRPEKGIPTDRASVTQSANLTSWQTISPSNKIPVYFVPHTKNHYPLALGLLHSAISSYHNGKLLKRFELVPITYMSPDKFLSGPFRQFGTGVWLFSNYLWSVETNLAISKFVKQNSAKNITIHGGPSTPEHPEMCEQFFNENSSIDITVHGEGEVSICEILDAFSGSKTNKQIQFEKLKDIAGISYKDFSIGSGTVYHTESRTRMKDPNDIFSPYISNVFDHYNSSVEAAIVETNRGCPFGCTFCDWGSAINQKVRKFNLDRAKDEITWIAKRITKVLWIADANFGIFDRDVEIAAHIIQMKKQYGFPQEVVVNYTKNTTERLVEIIKLFSDGGIISQGVISIQTLDTQTLEVINRKNIKLDKYEELRQIFQNMELPLSTDLMLGLPGSTIDGLKSDLQHYIDADVSVKAYPTQLLPNSPMADPDYIQKYKITISEDRYLTSSYSYSEQDLKQMKGLYKAFTMADGYGLLRYVIRFLQWEYGIRAVDFIYDLLCNLQKDTKNYPLLGFAISYFDTDKCIPSGWKVFYEELKQYLIQNYQIEDDSALNTVLEVNRAAMPDESIIYPYTINIEHDYIAYFTHNSQASAEQFIRLIEQSSAQMSFEDPDGLVEIDDTYLQYDSHQFFWELDSKVSRIRSAFTF